MNHCLHCGRVSAARLCPVCSPSGSSPRPTTGPARPTARTTRPMIASGSLPATPSAPPAPSAPAAPAPRHRWPTATGTTPLPTNAFPATNGEGRVLTAPQVSMSTARPDHALCGLAVPLLVIAIATSPGFIEAVVFWLIIVAIFVWLVERLGLGRMFGLLSIVSLVRMGGRRSAPLPPPPSLSFRCQLGGQPREVRIFGHDSGIELGDRVRVHGVPWDGRLRALRVVNLDSGAVLRRRGLVGLAVFALVDGLLVLTILGHLAAL